MSGDPEFDDFLKRRRPLFRRDVDDGLEPPPELDRIVLRQARDAIEEERPMRLFGMPRWAAPMAIAATLVLGLAVVLKTGMGPVDRVPEVRVENVAERLDYPPAPAAVPSPEVVASTPPAETTTNGAVVVDLAPPPAPAPALASRGEVSRGLQPGGATSTASPTLAAQAPAWRRDAKVWQAEIERLRASGDAARADAEQAEFNRQYRAMAVSPDR
jgi:hypothetical protein